MIDFLSKLWQLFELSELSFFLLREKLNLTNMEQ
jgi:hypothetical protein